MHGQLKSLQVVNIAKGEKRFRGKPLLDEKSLNQIKGINEMAYVMQEKNCEGLGVERRCQQTWRVGLVVASVTVNSG